MKLSHLRKFPSRLTGLKPLVGTYCVRRHVSRVSPLTSAFNTRGGKLFNFKLLESQSVGLFNIPELKTLSGVKILEEQCIVDINRLKQEACSADRKRKLVVVLDEMSDSICRVADMLEFLRLAHPDEKFRKTAQASLINLLDLVETLNTDIHIYKALKHVSQHGDVETLSDTDRRVTDLFIFDFEQSGIHLDDQRRSKFVQINNALVRICNNFMNGCQQPTPMMNFDLPKDLLNLFSFEGRTNSISAPRTEHVSEKIREATYRIHVYPNKHQEALLKDLIEGRRLLANTSDFPSFAHRALKGTLVESPENAMQFLESMAVNVREGAQKEYELMLERKQQFKALETGGDVQQGDYVRNNAIMPWDPAFFVKHARYELYNEETLSEYFSLGNAMEGLNMLFQALYGVSLENVTPGSGELWHRDVYKLAVTHEKEGLLGYIFCDFFDRADKTNSDCQFMINGGKLKANGDYQLPLVVVHLNLTSSGSSVPCLLSPGNLENLFHEFGHAMHAMLGRQQYQHVTGTRCPIDFAEVPSILMEYFAADPRVLGTFARHFETGQPLDEETLRMFCKSKRLFLHSETQLQIFYSILDQVYHGPDLGPQTPMQVLEATQNKYYGIPYVPNTAWHLRFSHLVGYGSKYYSYLVSRAIASKIWRTMFKQDPFNRANGERYRHQMLAFGGEKHPSVLVKDLLNETPTIDMLVQSLSEDLNSRNILPPTKISKF